MAIELLDPKQTERMRAAGRAAAETLAHVGARLQAGVRADQIDLWVREHTARQGGRPSQLGFHGFPAAVCVSPNEVVCHGIPNKQVALRNGDIVNVDVTTELDGFHGDTSMTFLVGQVRPEAQRLVETTKAALLAGIAEVRPGARGAACACAPAWPSRSNPCST